jgi:hypothetical protein
VWQPFACLLLAQRPPVGQDLLIHKVSRSHTMPHYSRWDSSRRVISSLQRSLPDNTRQSQQTSMPAEGFEPIILAGEWSQIHTLDRAATGTGKLAFWSLKFFWITFTHPFWTSQTTHHIPITNTNQLLIVIKENNHKRVSFSGTWRCVLLCKCTDVKKKLHPTFSTRHWWCALKLAARTLTWFFAIKNIQLRCQHEQVLVFIVCVLT